VDVPRYRKFNTFLRETFGRKVYKVGLRGGFSCPNRDGSKGLGGCIFCNQDSSEPLGYVAGMPLERQLAEGCEYIRERHGVDAFIAYFSDYSTTYASVRELEHLYREALSFPGVVGLALSTRPDCLSARTLDLLGRLARHTFLWVELGVQSADDRSLVQINRCHTVEDSRRAIGELRARGISVSAHVILGLPGESTADMLRTADFLRETGVEGVKIHNLHVIENTRLAEMYRSGEYESMELEEYAALAVAFLERLPPRVVVQRLSGEAPRRFTVAPAWSVNKLAVFNAAERELERRDTWQGRACGSSRDELVQPVSFPGAPARNAVSN
jgi:radical SAM protein (TIGR01212 family)